MHEGAAAVSGTAAGRAGMVGADGVAKQFKVVEGIGSGCEEEVINYLKKIDWIPKVQNGRPIDSEYVFTFSFGLN